MAVLATRILAFSIRLGCPTPIFLSKMKPSSKKESCRGVTCFRGENGLEWLARDQVGANGWAIDQLAREGVCGGGDASRVPPGFLIMWIASRSVAPFSRSTASTASFAKCSLSCGQAGQGA